jgi:hypothetical protein
MNDYDPTFKSFNSKVLEKGKSNLNFGLSRGVNKLHLNKETGHYKGYKKNKGYTKGIMFSRKNYMSMKSGGNSFMTNISNQKMSKNLKMGKLIENKIRKNSLRQKKGRSSSVTQDKPGKGKGGKKKQLLNVVTQPTESLFIFIILHFLFFMKVL